MNKQVSGLSGPLIRVSRRVRDDKSAESPRDEFGGAIRRRCAARISVSPLAGLLDPARSSPFTARSGLLT
jgi:hypothetical protein